MAQSIGDVSLELQKILKRLIRITSIYRAFEVLELHDVRAEQKVSDMQR